LQHLKKAVHLQHWDEEVETLRYCWLEQLKHYEYIITTTPNNCFNNNATTIATCRLKQLEHTVKLQQH
jgi:hypothetical protein